MLPSRALRAWLVLAGILRQLTKYEFTAAALDGFEQSIVADLQFLDKHLPVNILGLWYHQLLHVPRFIRLWGPPYAWWMLRFERHVGIIAKARKGNLHPDLNIVNRFTRTVPTSRVMVRYGVEAKQRLPVQALEKPAPHIVRRDRYPSILSNANLVV